MVNGSRWMRKKHSLTSYGSLTTSFRLFQVYSMCFQLVVSFPFTVLVYLQSENSTNLTLLLTQWASFYVINFLNLELCLPRAVFYVVSKKSAFYKEFRAGKWSPPWILSGEYDSCSSTFYTCNSKNTRLP